MSRMNHKKYKVGPLEMEVIGILESQLPMSVADIQKKLKTSDRDLAYTTVMTVLVRLHEKGLLERKRDGRQFLYSHAKKGSSLSQNMLTKIKRTLFRNEKLKPILALLDDEEKLSKKELIELRKIVDKKLREKKGDK